MSLNVINFKWNFQKMYKILCYIAVHIFGTEYNGLLPLHSVRQRLRMPLSAYETCIRQHHFSQFRKQEYGPPHLCEVYIYYLLAFYSLWNELRVIQSDSDDNCGLAQKFNSSQEEEKLEGVEWRAKGKEVGWKKAEKSCGSLGAFSTFNM